MWLLMCWDVNLKDLACGWWIFLVCPKISFDCFDQMFVNVEIWSNYNFHMIYDWNWYKYENITLAMSNINLAQSHVVKIIQIPPSNFLFVRFQIRIPLEQLFDIGHLDIHRIHRRVFSTHFKMFKCRSTTSCTLLYWLIQVTNL